MVIHPESKELLRETLEKYVHDLAEELLYWVEELNKLDTAEAEGTNPVPSADTAETRWATRTERGRSLEGLAPVSGE